MVSAAAIRSSVQAVDMLPAWGALYWMRHKLLGFTEALGEEATTVSLASLEDWTPSGAQAMKDKLRAWMVAGGRIGDLGMTDADFTQTVSALWGLGRSCIEQQVDHVQRTGLSLGRVQQCMLEQHGANHSGFLYNFFVDQSTSKLVRQWSVSYRPISLEIIQQLPASEVRALDSAKRVIVRICELPEEDAQGEIDRTIDFYCNENRDLEMLSVYQEFLVQSCGLTESTIDSMMGLFADLPHNDARVQLYKDPHTGNLSWNVGSADTMSSLADFLLQRQADAQEDTAQEDTTLEIDDTDPVDATDAEVLEPVLLSQLSSGSTNTDQPLSNVIDTDTSADVEELATALGDVDLNAMD